MSIVVLLSSLIIGLSLGVFGSGGAILTLPTLIYLLAYEEKLAIVCSLLIVGSIAFLSAFPHWFKKRISVFHLLCFSAPSIVSSYLGAFVGSQSATWLQLVLFVLLMLLAAFKILLTDPEEEIVEQKPKVLGLVFAGLFVGFMTGFVGVGGGFLIVPALMFLGYLNIYRATATSLVIIFLQSGLGLLSYKTYSPELFNQIDWSLIVIFVGIGSIGSYFGLWLKTRINQEWLTRVFAYFLILMATLIFADRLFG